MPPPARIPGLPPSVRQPWSPRCRTETYNIKFVLCRSPEERRWPSVSGSWSIGFRSRTSSANSIKPTCWWVLYITSKLIMKYTGWSSNYHTLNIVETWEWDTNLSNGNYTVQKTGSSRGGGDTSSPAEAASKFRRPSSFLQFSISKLVIAIASSRIR